MNARERKAARERFFEHVGSCAQCKRVANEPLELRTEFEKSHPRCRDGIELGAIAYSDYAPGKSAPRKANGKVKARAEAKVESEAEAKVIRTEINDMIEKAMDEAAAKPKRSDVAASVLKSSSGLPDVWVAKDGSTVKIADMDDAYVMNALRVSMWAASLGRAKLDVFYVTCEEPTGDGASSAFDMETEMAFEATWSDHTDAFFEALKLDARRRGLAGSSDAELNALGADMDVRTRRIELRLIQKAEVAALDAKIESAKTDIKKFRRERRAMTRRT